MKTTPSESAGSAYYETYWNPNDEWTPDAGGRHPVEAEIFNTYLAAGIVLLDYGCGNGLRYGLKLSAMGIEYRGFDVSQTALAQAREAGLQVDEIGAKGELPLPDGVADAAICFEVLEHLLEPETALAAIHKALKPGAVALISVPNAAYWTQRLDFLLTGFFSPGGSPLTARRRPWNDPHIRFFNRRMLRNLVKHCGFEVERELSEAFSFAALPWFYRQPGWRRRLAALSRPVAWLGQVLPSLFSPRLFVVARKPGLTSAKQAEAPV